MNDFSTLFISLFALQTFFTFFFSFFKLFLLLRLSKMPKNFSPRPTLCSGLGKNWYILVGRARPKTVNFFHLHFPFNSHFFLFQLFSWKIINDFQEFHRSPISLTKVKGYWRANFAFQLLSTALQFLPSPGEP